MLVPDLQFIELGLVAGVDLLEDVLEAAIVLLEDGVLGGQVEGVLTADRELEAAVGELVDRFVGVVHRQHNTGTLKLVDFQIGGGGAVSWGKGHGEGAGDFGDKVGRSVLVTESVSADDDGLGPAGNASGDVVHDDGLTEDGAADDVANSAVGGLPHLLETELLDSCLVSSDGRALDADLAGLDRIGTVNAHLIVGGIAVLNAQVVVLDVEVQVGENELKFV